MIEIYNEDCYEGIKRIPDKSVDLVYIDPPYVYDKGFGERLTKNKIRNNYLEEISDGFNFTIFEELCRVLKNIYIYIWCSEQQVYLILDYFIKKGCSYKILGWHKQNPMPMYSKRYMNDVEFCLLIKDNKAHFNGKDTFDNSFTFYNYPINANDKKIYDHPTIKPLFIVKNHIEKSTGENDVVLDCFMGSGTTGVACKELNRSFIGFEINPSYFKIAQDRINGITQIERKKINDGQLCWEDL